MWLVRRNERYFTVFSFRAGCSTKYHTACRPGVRAPISTLDASSHPGLTHSLLSGAATAAAFCIPAAGPRVARRSLRGRAPGRWRFRERFRPNTIRPIPSAPRRFKSHADGIIVTCRIHSHMPQRVAEPRPKLRRPKLRVHTCVWLPRFPDGGCRGAPSCLPTCRPQPATCAAVRARRGLLRASQRAA